MPEIVLGVGHLFFEGGWGVGGVEDLRKTFPVKLLQY